MKIIFFTGEFTEGGAERVISILTNEFVRRGFDIEILKYLNTENFYSVNEIVKITSVIENTKTNNKLTNLKWMHNYFKNNADLVISFLASWNIMALLANAGNKVPIIVADRNDPYKIPSNPLIRKARDILYYKADYVVLQTLRNQRYFSKSIQNKSVVIPNPIDLGDKVGKALKTPKENVIVNVGRLKPQKNQKMLINSFKEVLNKYPDYKLVIYGEGDYRKELEKHIDNLDLKDKVILAGNQKDVLDKIMSAKLFVMSSDYEGMPNALIEAMCLGLPCISTKVSGTEELIEDGVNGLLVDTRNEDELTKAILKMLNEKKLQNVFGENSKKISKKLKVSCIVGEWTNIINKITR